MGEYIKKNILITAGRFYTALEIARSFHNFGHNVYIAETNKLHFSVHMRSNDAILGLPTDVAFFTMLQQQMWKQLKESPYTDKYKDLELGHYIHFDNSLHLYDRNFKLVEEMLSEDFKPSSLPSLKTDFIDSKGHMTQQMLQLNDLIRKFTFDENATFINFSFKDPLFDWIIDAIQSSWIPWIFSCSVSKSSPQILQYSSMISIIIGHVLYFCL